MAQDVRSKTVSIHAIIKLTRWQEFVPFTTILTWLGGLLAYRVRDAQLDWRLLAVLVANLCAVAYAFMINDIEDADDDALDPERGGRNPVATGEISRRAGWLVSLVVAIVALIGYALGGAHVFMTGVVIVVLAHLYSWHPVRLKARRLVDILSHGLFLSTLLFLAAFFIYTTEIGYLWTIVVGTFLISAYGQLYNQVRDYESDQAAGLHNTASVLGKRGTEVVSQLTVIGFVVCILVAILMGAFPLWLGPILLLTIPVVWLFLRNDATDMRGSQTDDAVALIQRQFLLVVNIVLLVWLMVAWFL